MTVPMSQSHQITQTMRSLRRRVGANIHDLRLRRSITLEKLGRRCGLPPDVLDRIELGKGDLSMPVLVGIALALRIDPMDLFLLPVPARG